MYTDSTTRQSAAAALFAKLRPSIRHDAVGASLGDAWLPGAAWDGVSALFALADDEQSRRGITAFLVEIADHIDDDAWQQLVLQIARELEQPGAQTTSAMGSA